MGQKVSRSDFEWVYTEEPHASRRKVILKKYPEIKGLMGPDPNTKWVVLCMVTTQVLAMTLVQDLPWTLMILAAYLFGGVINHSLTLANHEISHNLAFGHSRPLANRLLGLFANLPIGVPVSVAFKKYHLEHHRYQGDDSIDVDIPSRLEARLFTCTLTKLVWVVLQPVFYAFRPLCVRPKPVSVLEVVNVVVQVLFNLGVYHLVGAKALTYLITGSFMSMGLHPVAGHFISEHYMFKKGFETYSYYGPLNSICFNVGYHVEHHDFPSIPGSRLPMVKQIASEFYDHNPCHYSWTKVLWDFITDPQIGPYARVKRVSPVERATSEGQRTSGNQGVMDRTSRNKGVMDRTSGNKGVMDRTSRNKGVMDRTGGIKGMMDRSGENNGVMDRTGENIDLSENTSNGLELSPQMLREYGVTYGPEEVVRERIMPK